MTHLRSALLLLALLTALVLPAQAQDLSPAAQEAARSNNEFALDLYQRLSDKEEGNLFFSPYSISTVLRMVHAGARGETATEMAKVLRLDPAADPGQAAGEGVKDLIHALRNPQPTAEKPAAGAADRVAGRPGLPTSQAGQDPVKQTAQTRIREAIARLKEKLERRHALHQTLKVANGVYPDASDRPLPSYLSLLQSKFGAQASPLDYQRAPQAARASINGDIERFTGIEDLLPEGSITSDTRLVLTNAITFKESWVTKFDPAKTRESFWMNEDGTTEQVSFMNAQKMPVRMAYKDGVIVADLPYSNNRSLTVVLPGTFGGPNLAEVEQRLARGELAEQLNPANMREAEMPVMLPKFTMKLKQKLKPTLSAMGMPRAFGGADFSGINGKKNLKISEVYHEAKIEVSEEGTKAEGATAAVVVRESAMVGLQANRPFVFMIRDDATGAILFMGRLVKP